MKDAVEEIKSEEEKIELAVKEKLTEEEEKKKADSLWAGKYHCYVSIFAFLF